MAWRQANLAMDLSSSVSPILKANRQTITNLSIQSLNPSILSGDRSPEVPNWSSEDNSWMSVVLSRPPSIPHSLAPSPSPMRLTQSAGRAHPIASVVANCICPLTVVRGATLTKCTNTWKIQQSTTPNLVSSVTPRRLKEYHPAESSFPWSETILNKFRYDRVLFLSNSDFHFIIYRNPKW